jgi:nucleotide-binding universal stress UspA family protein
VEPIFEECPEPSPAILRKANEQGVDLIVMNTRGRTLAAAVLLGSITSETMIQTHVPILTVKHFGSRMTMREALMQHRFWEKPTPKTS